MDVTRDENGKLIADPAEIEFVVKEIGSGEPSKPTEPEKPTTPTQPGGDTQSPETGDSGNLNLWFALSAGCRSPPSRLSFKKFRRNGGKTNGRR